jgi:hypothetical protein
MGLTFLPRPVWIMSLLFTLPTITGMTGMCRHAQLSVEIGVLQTFCPGWSWTTIFLISISQVAKVTGVSHWCPARRWHFLRLFFSYRPFPHFWTLSVYILFCIKVGFCAMPFTVICVEIPWDSNRLKNCWRKYCKEKYLT